MNKSKYLIRIALSPLFFIIGALEMVALSFFLPLLPFFVLYNIIAIISMPLIWLLNKTGSGFKYLGVFYRNSEDIKSNKERLKHYCLGATVFIWGAFYTAGYYIKTGKKYDLEKDKR